MEQICDECHDQAVLYLLEDRARRQLRERWLCGAHASSMFHDWPLRYEDIAAANSASEGAYIPHRVAAVAIPTSESECCVYLERIGSQGSTMLVMGQVEARAVAAAWLRTPHSRPLTHATTVGIMQSLGGSLSKVVISDLIDRVYYANLHIIVDATGKDIYVDVRPSDAVTLALICACPIYIVESVIRKQRERFGEMY